MTVPIVLLLALGWWMAANAHTIYDSEQSMFVPIRSLLPNVAGSIDQAVTTAWMVRATVLLGTVCLVADACRDPAWLLRLWTTLGGVGGSIALLGLMEKASAARMIFWGEVAQPVTTFFGTFYYHGNAGAFLNLTLPLTLGLAMRAFTRRSQPILRTLWLILAIVSVVAVFANTSRMGQVTGALIILIILAGVIPHLSAGIRRMEWTTAAVGAVVLAFALLAVIYASRFDRSLKRWERISETVPLDARWVAPKAALRAMPEAGWAGFGAGTFHIIFPYYTAGMDERLRGFWLYLHQDYLQTLLEWGWVGGALWASLFLGGIAVAFRNRFSGSRAESWSPRQRLLLPLVLLGLGSVMLHALVDFPLQIASIQLYAATYLGICWGSSRWGLNT